MGLARITSTNLLHRAGAVIVPSSEQTGLARAALTRSHRSDVLRFQAGWDIATGVNDALAFNRTGIPNFGLIPAGHYATGTAMAAAVVAGLEAGDSIPVWACSYNATTKKFTISTAAHNVELLFASGHGNAPIARSAHIDIGFATADTASALSHAGGSQAFQSRRWVNLDTGPTGAFVVTAGVNDKIDIRFGANTSAATIPAGTYSNGHELALAILIAVNAVTPVSDLSAVTFDVATSKFTFSSSSGFDLLFGTGANIATSLHPDLGFTSTDKTGGSGYTSENAAPAAALFVPAPSFDTVVVLGFNGISGATLRMDASHLTMLASPIGVVPATPAGGSSVTVPATGLPLYTTSTSRRHLRLVLSDVQNPAGYNELGVWWPGA